MMAVSALAAAGFLCLSALVSVAETAAFSVRPSRLRTLTEEGFKGADRLSDVHEEAPAIRASLFLANTFLNTLAAALLVGELVLLQAAVGFWVGAPAAAFLVLFVGEIVPRSIAERHPIRIALLSAPFLLRIHGLSRAFLSRIIHLERLLDRRNGEDGETPEHREVRELAEIGRMEGVVEEEEHLLVERAFRLDELMAWNVMTPRVDIFALHDGLTLEEVVDQLAEIPFSRVPLYGESIDDVTGILSVREAYEHHLAGQTQTPLLEVARPPMFVPGSLPLTRLLREFQARRMHMGIVADEFGGTDGLVTLEDVLEELVGDIEDETDISDETFVRISRTEAVADGTVDLRELNSMFKISLPHLEHRSLNGYLLEEFGRVPEPGERMERPGLVIEVMEATETQVVRARIRKTEPASVEEGP